MAGNAKKYLLKLHLHFFAGALFTTEDLTDLCERHKSFDKTVLTWFLTYMEIKKDF